MKKIILLALAAISFLSLNAQEKSDQKADKNINFRVIPKSWKIQDFIKVTNRSPYLILQVVVAEVVDHELVPLGSATNIRPNRTESIAAFKYNSLKHLKGKTIAIKAKALKTVLGDQSGTDVSTPFGDVTVRHMDVDKESANLGPEDVTYEFDVKLFEDRHDLYIELYNAAGNDIMNF